MSLSSLTSDPSLLTAVRERMEPKLNPKERLRLQCLQTLEETQRSYLEEMDHLMRKYRMMVTCEPGQNDFFDEK